MAMSEEERMEDDRMRESEATAGERRGESAAAAGAQSASPEREPAAVRAGEQRAEDPESPNQVLQAGMPGHEAADAAVLAASHRDTRRAFLLGGAATAVGAGFYAWLNLGKEDEAQPMLLRKTFDANAALSRGLFREEVLAPTFPLRRAETLRVNGIYGLKKDLDLGTWRLQVVGMAGVAGHARYTGDVTAWEYGYMAQTQGTDVGHDTKVAPRAEARMEPGSDTGNKMPRAGMQDNNPDPNDPAGTAPAMPPHAGQQGSAGAAGAGAEAAEDENHTGRKPRGMEEAGESNSTLPPGTPGLLLRMEDVLALPRQELVTRFVCIEGWSQIVHWAGVRFRDFLDRYPPATIDGREPKYVYMETPDGDYYVGYDLQALRHPQALLVTEMMGMPLTQSHGAPLRLHLPTRYGYKQIKRIGLIAYTNELPDDYWTKLGYDWYAGL